MLIRSQCRNVLVNIDLGMVVINAENTIAFNPIGEDLGTGKGILLGRYSSGDKVIKVLDAIESYYVNIVNNRCRVYKMPLDSEVEGGIGIDRKGTKPITLD